MMRKPNYNMERKDRERAKQAKAAAKLEKRAAKGGDDRQPDESAPLDGSDPAAIDRAKSEG
jgi:hypothetical protein